MNWLGNIMSGLFPEIIVYGWNIVHYVGQSTGKGTCTGRCFFPCFKQNEIKIKDQIIKKALPIFLILICFLVFY